MVKILLVEDQDDIRNVLQLALESRGHEIDAYADGESALRAIESWWPEFAILDSGLPGMSGLEVGQAIVERTGDQKRMFMALFTGTDTHELRQQAREAGFDFFVCKPISVNDFCDKVDQLSRESL